MCEKEFIRLFRICYPISKYHPKDNFYNYAFTKVPKWACNENVVLFNKNVEDIEKLPGYKDSKQIREAASEALKVYDNLCKNGCIKIPDSNLVMELNILKTYNDSN